MRGREFTMKDAYSFDRDQVSAKASYRVMAQTYRRIFDRFGLTYRAVAADSGAIGGDLSEEFQVIAATGEDAIVYCPQSDYAANMGKGRGAGPSGRVARRHRGWPKVATPGKSTCADVAELLGVPLKTTVKSLVLATDETNAAGEIVKTQVWLLLLRGDHDMNEIKVAKGAGAGGLPLRNPWARLTSTLAASPVIWGPSALKKPLKIVADREVTLMADWICGANEADFHTTGVNWGRDLPEPDAVADLRNVVAGDPRRMARGNLPLSAASKWAMSSISAPSTAAP